MLIYVSYKNRLLNCMKRFYKTISCDLQLQIYLANRALSSKKEQQSKNLQNTPLLAGYLLVYQFQSTPYGRRHFLALEFARARLKIIIRLQPFAIVILYTFLNLICVFGTHFGVNMP